MGDIISLILFSLAIGIFLFAVISAVRKRRSNNIKVKAFLDNAAAFFGGTVKSGLYSASFSAQIQGRAAQVIFRHENFTGKTEPTLRIMIAHPNNLRWTQSDLD